jgi:hypothetical protein
MPPTSANGGAEARLLKRINWSLGRHSARVVVDARGGYALMVWKAGQRPTFHV